MGGRNSKNSNSSINSDFCPLRVASIYVDLGESINKKKKIQAMVEYIMHDYYGYKIDVLCIQGIKSYKILKEMIREFKSYMLKYNDKHAKNGQDVYLEYFPDIEITENKDDMNWSTSETEETDFYDKLIITRHKILSKATPALGVRDDGVNGYSYTHSYPNQEFLKRGDTIMYNRDSDSVYDGRRHIQVANLNVNGTYVSIYNVELKSDVKGIRSSKERKAQIFDLKELINQNTENSKDDRVREFEYGDDKYVAHNRNLHIVTGMFHINEMRNDELNPEYIRTVKVLEGLDTHRWVMSFRNRVNPESTNIKFSKDSYTMMISRPILDTADLQGKARSIYQEHKTLIISSIIQRNSVDMSYFTNYPLDTLFMIYKPKIGYAENGILRPDHFIRQEVYSRLTSKDIKQRSKHVNVIDNDYRTLDIKHKINSDRSHDRYMNIDASIDCHTDNSQQSIDHSGNNSDHKTSDHKTSDHKTSDHKTSDHKTSDHKTSDHKTINKHIRTKTTNQKHNHNKSKSRHDKTKRNNPNHSAIQHDIDMTKNTTIQESAKDNIIDDHPSTIDLLIDRYEPPGEEYIDDHNGSNNSGDIDTYIYDSIDNDTKMIVDTKSNDKNNEFQSDPNTDNTATDNTAIDNTSTDNTSTNNTSTDNTKKKRKNKRYVAHETKLKESIPVIHRGKSLITDVSIDTDSEDDLANDAMMRMIY
jgi:hypothetical protein